MTVSRLFFNLLVKDLAQSTAFYKDLFEMDVRFESDWFVLLGQLPTDGKDDAETVSFELGLVSRDHDIAPASSSGSPQGLYPTFVVNDLEAIHARAQQRGFTILEPPTDMFYGQRRLLLRDPDGLTVDVSAPVAPPPT